MILEFAGPPGVGKSTIADFLLLRLSQDVNEMLQFHDVERKFVQSSISYVAYNNHIMRKGAYLGYCLRAYLLSVRISLVKNRSIPLKKPYSSVSYWHAKDILLSKYYL